MKYNISWKILDCDAIGFPSTELFKVFIYEIKSVFPIIMHCLTTAYIPVNLSNSPTTVR